MTVNELIDELESYDGDLNVVIISGFPSSLGDTTYELGVEHVSGHKHRFVVINPGLRIPTFTVEKENE